MQLFRPLEQGADQGYTHAAFRNTAKIFCIEIENSALGRLEEAIGQWRSPVTEYNRNYFKLGVAGYLNHPVWNITISAADDIGESFQGVDFHFVQKLLAHPVARNEPLHLPHAGSMVVGGRKG